MSAKKPVADAATKAIKTEAKDDEPKTVDYDGVTYTLDPESADDLELVEALADFDETRDRIILPRIVKSLIGEPAYAAFKTKYRGANGRVPFTVLLELWTAIDDSLGE